MGHRAHVANAAISFVKNAVNPTSCIFHSSGSIGMATTMRSRIGLADFFFASILAWNRYHVGVSNKCSQMFDSFVPLHHLPTHHNKNAKLLVECNFF